MSRRRGHRGTGRAPGIGALWELFDSLPASAAAAALTHSSWSSEREGTYGRLAFLGDSVLGLAVAEHLYREHRGWDIGRLTKVHGQAVSGRACAEVARELGVPERLRARARSVPGGVDAETLIASERALASICEAVIGACYLHHPYPEVAEAVVAAFAAQLDLASGSLLDFKSALQEALARRGEEVRYQVRAEHGPPHARQFEVEARVADRVVGRGSGSSKKAAEQAAAERALESVEQ